MLGDKIKEILYEYVKIESFTNTSGERLVEEFFTGHFEKIPYFKEHPENWGLYPLEDDPLQRNVCWAIVRGKGNKTVAMVHHYDIVDIEDYKLLKPLAFSPDELAAALADHKDMLPEDALVDLEAGSFVFCRGGCDMKAGGAIQYALLEEYSKLANFEGNVIVLGVPDEENLSAGMRAAVRLLAELKEKQGLEYLMMINSEPHQRKDFSKGVFSEGTVGKMMPFVYVRGFLSHAGKVFEGLNPVSVLSEIVAKTEVNMDFADVVDGEAAPPPTWLYQKDSKDRYDVSMPLSAQGCFSVLTLKQTPAELLGKVKRVCEDGFLTVIERLNENYEKFLAATGQPVKKLPWKVKTVGFGELYEEAKAQHGTVFEEAYEMERERILRDLAEGRINMIEGNFQLIEKIYDYIEDISPRVVYGLLPPYYPNVSNVYFDGIAEEASGLSEKLSTYTQEEYGQIYDKEYFYTGICDLSYINIDDPTAQRESVAGAMPLFGAYYDIPFEQIKAVSMAGINIGPWGKDFHKLTERVYKEDLYERTPRILDYAVKLLLK
ncbi:M20/M25/M40 family metallo-hydrolase [Anaerotruncus sp. 80]|uniref:M20/M25/M40 family metallo-hydrolase n=1 Tax=Anaerotruncus colihominis TaxID=169435 RepID=A0A845QG03_9FIRM|nr:M20/M25/M40 family metallo-hydrolase [Anaerotruncus colihominis]NCF01323.1 M20/M25/M40 family metallo-hydrolase [Anaerotruncus sp. 80]